MIFNLAQQNKLSPELKREQVLHLTRMKQPGREAALQEDAKRLAIMARQLGKNDPSELMDSKIQYWDFVKQFDKKYFDDVVNLAKRLIPNVDKMIPLVPTSTQPAPGGAPGAAPPQPGAGGAIGSNTNLVKLSSGVYLHRLEKKPHKFMGSFASDIIGGKQQYLTEEGHPVVLRLEDQDDLIVPVNSPAAKEASRLQQELPDKITQEIETFLSSNGSDHSKSIAKAAFLRIRRNKNFDLLPVSVEIGNDIAKSIMMVSRIAGFMEPERIHGLRASIGKVMTPYMKKLKNALKVSGIQFREVLSPLPSYTSEGSRQKEHHELSKKSFPDKLFKPKEVRVLDKDEVDTSMDFRSLLLTATSRLDYSEEAAIRLMFVMSKYPSIYSDNKLSTSDIEAIKISIPQYGSGIAKIATLIDSDDADVMAEYMSGSSFERVCMSFLVLAQHRMAIIAAMPEMCIEDDQLNVDFFSNIDTTQPHGVNVLKMILLDTLPCPPDIMSKKLMEATYSHVEDVELRQYCLTYDKKSMLLALAMIAQDYPEILKETLYQISASGMTSLHSDHIDEVLAMATIAVINVLGGDFENLDLNPKPSLIASIFGRDIALKYMRDTRRDWEGDHIPVASEIFSAPDNPLPLARNLDSIADIAGMLVLLDFCLKRHGKSEPIDASISLLSASLCRLKSECHRVHEMALRHGVNLDDQGHIAGDIGEASPERFFSLLKSNDIVGAAHCLSSIFESDEELAKMALEHCPEPSSPKLFIEMLPVELVSECILPRWARQNRISAFSLPTGHVVSAKNGVYHLGESIFSCKSSDAMTAGFKAIQKEEVE